MNLTVVMITHQMEVVRDACDCVAVLDQGRIVEEGVVSEIFAHPKHDVTKDFLSSVTNMQESVIRWSQETGHYTLRFRGKSTDEPILSEVSNKTGALFNIRAAGVQNVDGEEMGVMALDIGPDIDTVRRAIECLVNRGVIVEEEGGMR